MPPRRASRRTRCRWRLALVLGCVLVAARVAAQTAAQSPMPAGTVEVQALHAAYPQRVGPPRLQNGEWTIITGGQAFRWADGRLLPTAELRSPAEYTPFRFYSDYAAGPLQIQAVDPELAARLRARTERAATDAPPRDPRFSDALYGVADRASAELRMTKVDFLDRTVWVHQMLVVPLARVERTIHSVAATDPTVAQFVADLRLIAGFTWRNIAGTQSRSYHSYGIAVDLVPRTYGSKVAYWRWAADAGIDTWWEVPPSGRWLVPQPIIAAFEAEGFIWGGKWRFFDNLHFEFRPEVALIAASR
jgi:hypothetical protein